MKKRLLTVLCIIMISSGIVSARTSVSPDLSNAIRLYKAGNFTGCYAKLDNVIKKDPSNSLAYYYKAMTSAQIGRKAEAIENYNKAVALAPENSNIYRYAKKGARCLETPEQCEDLSADTEVDKFIKRINGPKFSDKVRSDYERLKLENLMREMNRNNDISPDTFREYRDFSSMNMDSETPSNDEIVAAMRVLQKSGLFNNSGAMDLSLLTGENNYNQNAMLNLMGGAQKLDPKVLQAIMTSNMLQGF